jgi:hypothetical protein
MKRLALIAALTTVALILGPSPASAKYWQKCGGQHKRGAAWFAVKSHNVPCGKARGVAHRYTWHQDRSPAGFSCRETQIGDEVWRVACRRNAGNRVQKVRFSFGA